MVFPFFCVPQSFFEWPEVLLVFVQFPSMNIQRSNAISNRIIHLIQSYFWRQLWRYRVIIDGVWIGNWIYWTR
jgi:hypothetical protein